MSVAVRVVRAGDFNPDDFPRRWKPRAQMGVDGLLRVRYRFEGRTRVITYAPGTWVSFDQDVPK